MRIIAGIHRHRRLIGPKEGDLTTRPILDRVKQALFDRLWAMGMFPEPAADGTIVPEGYVLDIFCGTGSLGLEALSRGSDHCTFIERDRHALGALKQNIAALQLEDQATILPTDALAGVYLGNLHHKPLRLVFLDPPYAMMSAPGSAPAPGSSPGTNPGPSGPDSDSDIPPENSRRHKPDRATGQPDKVYALLAMLAAPEVMETQGVVVLRVPERTEILPVPGFADPVVHAYGKMLLAFYRRS